MIQHRMWSDTLNILVKYKQSKLIADLTGAIIDWSVLLTA